jgi:hypothetical protein
LARGRIQGRHRRIPERQGCVRPECNGEGAPSAGDLIEAEAKIAHGRQMIALAERRRAVRFVDTLRKLPDGKIEKFELRARQCEEQGSRA